MCSLLSTMRLYNVIDVGCHKYLFSDLWMNTLSTICMLGFIFKLGYGCWIPSGLVSNDTSLNLKLGVFN